jgi:nicotinate-nucleotide--dimethylbenzimidazole phosphoribosyltransferase
VLLTGDMGIGNTTASSAIASIITGAGTAETTGLGTGIGLESWRKKCGVIKAAIEKLQPDSTDALDILHKVGGLEIGAIAGVILGSAARRRPVIIDGVVATAGALIATLLSPGALSFLFAGHRSGDHGHTAMLAHLDLRPLLQLDMRLGEGTGALLALPLLEAAVATLNEMPTFEEAGISGPDEAVVIAD